MSDSGRSSFASRLTQLFFIMALICYVAPSIAGAEPFLLLHTAGNPPPIHEKEGHADKSSVTVGLNENGDLTIRHSDLSLVVAYNPPSDVIDPQERLRMAQRQDCPTISGISIKVSLLF